MLLQQTLVVLAGVLDSTIRMHHELLARVFPRESHLQRIHDKPTVDRVRHRPADDPPREQVLDHSQVQPTLDRRNVRDVGRPCFILPRRSEVSIHDVPRDRVRVIRIGRAHAKATLRFRSQPGLFHVFCDGLALARLALSNQLRMHARRTVCGVTGSMNVSNPFGQRGPALSRNTRPTTTPRVVPTTRDSQHVALNRHRPAVSMIVDEAVSHLDSFAKKAVAFLRSHVPSAVARSLHAADGIPLPEPSAERLDDFPSRHDPTGSATAATDSHARPDAEQLPPPTVLPSLPTELLAA